MDRARELKRGGSRHSPAKLRQPKASGHKLLSALNGGDMETLERSKKEKVRGSINEDSEIMGGGSEGEEEFRLPGSSCGRRFKLNGKGLDDCNAVDPATVPRRLRSAMNKRTHEFSPPLPDAKKKNRTFLGTELSHVNGVKKPKLHMKLGGSERFSKQLAHNTISKDEEEVAEALYALASMVDEPDKSEIDRKAVEAGVPSPLRETRAGAVHTLEASKEESTQSLDIYAGAEVASPNLHMEESTAKPLNVQPVGGLAVSEQPISGDQKFKLELNDTAQVDAPGIDLSSKDKQTTRAQLNGAVNSTTPNEAPSETHPKTGLLETIKPESLSTRRPDNVQFPAIAYATQQVSKPGKENVENFTHSKEGALDLHNTLPNGLPDDLWHLKQTSSTKAGALPDPSPSASRPGSTGKSDTLKEKPVLVLGGRRQSLKRCAYHVYISRFICACQSRERKSWTYLSNQSKLNDGKATEITASNDQAVLKTGMNNVMPVGAHGLVADRNFCETRPGTPQHNKLLQEQQCSTSSGIYPPQKQSCDFLSSSAGCESTRNPGNGLESSVPLHTPYLHPLVQHPLMPFSLPHARYSSPYPDQLAASQQVQMKLPQYSANPFFGPQLVHGSSAKQQQLWAAQMAHYRPCNPSSPHPPKWQNGRYDGSPLNPCSQAIVPPPSSLEVLGPKYMPKHPQHLFAVSSSSSSSRAKRPHYTGSYEEGGNASGGGTPQLQQLLCNAQNT